MIDGNAVDAMDYLADVLWVGVSPGIVVGFVPDRLFLCNVRGWGAAILFSLIRVWGADAALVL